MTRKYELTEEHRAQLEPWAQKWIDIAFKTGQYTDTDKTRIREAMDGLYRAADLEPPKVGIFCSSPAIGAMTAVIMAAMEDERVAGTDETLLNEARDIAMSVVEAACKDQTPVWPKKHRALKLAKKLLKNCDSWSSMWDGGNNWVGHTASISFFRHVVKIGETHGIDYSKWAHYETMTEYGPRFMHEKFWIVSCLPKFIKKDEQNRPHAEDGPFCSYGDGTEVFYYYWHGTRVPQKWIDEKSTIDPSEILNYANSEVRRAGCEIIGWTRIMQLLDARVVDTDPDDHIGTLMEADLPDSPNSRFLSVLCGTGRRFVIPVPRETEDGKLIDTALKAQSWIYEEDVNEIKQYVART